MTKKLETKNSLIWGKRGSFYFSPILMTLKKSFVLPGKFIRQRRGQAALEYFVILSAILAVTLLSVSFFFPKVKKITTDFYNKTAQEIIGVPPLPHVHARFKYPVGWGLQPCDTRRLESGGDFSRDMPDKGVCIYGVQDVQCWRDYCTGGTGIITADQWNSFWGMSLDPTRPAVGSGFCPNDIIFGMCCPYVVEVDINIDGLSQTCTFSLHLNETGSGGGGCFLGGALVSLADGSVKKIEDIKIGDKVLSLDEKTRKKVASKVTRAFTHKADEYLIINEKIKATSNHLFYSEGKWQEIGKLSKGKELLTLSLEKEKITTIKKIKARQINVYNLEVDKYQNYFAGGYLVHNKPKCSFYNNGHCPTSCKEGPVPPGKCINLQP